MMTTMRTVAHTMTRFARSGNGSIAMMTGVMFPIIILAAGGVADVTRAQSIQTKAQQTLDAAVLSMAQSDMTDDQIASDGRGMFEAWMIDRRVDGTITEADFTARKTGIVPGQPGQVKGAVTLESPNYFLSIFGRQAFTINISTTSSKPNPLPYEISLVLDVSGSMNEMLNGRTRIERMKEATTDMLQELQRQSRGRDAPRVALIPYSTSVNIGDLGNGILEGSSIDGKDAPAPGTDVWAAERAHPLNGERYALTEEGPAIAPIPFVTAEDMPEATPNVRVQGPSETPAKYRKAIKDLEAKGYTAAHMGMIWGVYALSPDWSAVWDTRPRPYGYAKKVIVVLTDGEFNTTHNVGARSTEDGESSNHYFQSACDLAKKKGITIYTIALNLEADSKALLSACAAGSDGRMFTADSAKELSEAFANIAKELGSLRVSS